MPRKLILPGDVSHRGGLTIHVPRGHETKERFGWCHVCGAKFAKGEEAKWQRHVGECARANIDELRAAGARQRQEGTVFDENQWDPEWAAHQREVGKRMLREGRLVPHKSER